MLWPGWYGGVALSSHGVPVWCSAYKPNSRWNWWLCWTLSKQTAHGPSNTLHTPALSSGQRRTPSIHRLCNIHWGRALGRASGWPQRWLWAIIPASGANSHPERKGKKRKRILTTFGEQTVFTWCKKCHLVQHMSPGCLRHKKTCSSLSLWYGYYITALSATGAW